MEIPDRFPSQDEVDRKRDEIENLYTQMGMEQTYMQDMADAQQMVGDEGVNPQQRIGGHIVNVMLQTRVQELASGIAEEAQDVASN